MFEAYCQQTFGALQFENVALKAKLHEATVQLQEAEKKLKEIEEKLNKLAGETVKGDENVPEKHDLPTGPDAA